MFIAEKLHGDYHQCWTEYELVVDRQTDFQHLMIINTKTHGKVLLLDDIVQLTELDEFFYSEAMSHPTILQHDKESINVLIIGGGDGAVAEEALKHPNTFVTMAEIDPVVIEECNKHLKSVNNGILGGHPRLKLVVGDGLEYLRNADQLFDVISTDRPDPVGPAKGLFEKELYELCRDKLSNTGILVAQNGVPVYQPAEYWETKNILKATFNEFGFFHVAVPTYVGGTMALAYGSNRPLVSEKDMFMKLCSSGLPLKFFNSSIYQGMQATPTYLLKND